MDISPLEKLFFAACAAPSDCYVTHGTQGLFRKLRSDEQDGSGIVVILNAPRGEVTRAQEAQWTREYHVEKRGPSYTGIVIEHVPLGRRELSGEEARKLAEILRENHRYRLNPQTIK